MHELSRSPGRYSAVGLLGEGVRRAQLLDAQPGEPLTHIDGSLEGLAPHNTSKEATREGVTAFSLAHDWH